MTDLRMLRARCVLALAAIVLLAGAMAARADTNAWTVASGTNDWYGDTNYWSLTHFPLAGEDVVITNAGVGVLLTNSAPASSSFNSLVISNTATLIFSNWDTALSATDVKIQKSSIVTCAGPFTNSPEMSNRVWLVCSNLFIAASASINANGKGYTGGAGPGSGTAVGQGGGYGGQGQTAGGIPGGAPYGSAETPVEPGSGGFGVGVGGGAVRVDAQGLITVNGTITANANGSVDAPGSGGAIYITCKTFAGTNGIVSADGGSPLNSSTRGGGGGGRIAIRYAPALQTNLPVPGVTFSAAAGKRANNAPPGQAPNAYRGDLGTLYLTDASWLTETIPHSGRLIIPSFTSWCVSQLTVTNGWIRFSGEDFRLTVTNDAQIIGWYARLDLGAAPWTNRAAFNNYCNPTVGPTLTVGGDLILTNEGSLFVHSGVTNGVPRDYGALVSVGGTMTVGASSWIVPISHPTDGGSVFFQVRHLVISGINGGFDASGRGWAGGYQTNGYGLGGGLSTGTVTSAGGGYGGLGRNSKNLPSGATYGSSNAPVAPGSGGGYTGGKAGNGGGVVRVEAAGTVTLNGTIKADAMSDGSIFSSVSAGGASGGGIYITCRDITSTNGFLSAKGGPSTSSNTGVGGGGRIAVWFWRSDTTGATVSNSVAGGTSPTVTADVGTVVWKKLPARGTLIELR